MYLIFDTETTGLPQNWKAPLTDFNNWPRCVQLAWQVHDVEGKLVDVKNYIIKPEGYDIPFNAEKIHGISTGRANKQGMPLAEVLAEFVTDVEKCKFVVGHNVSFDNSIVGCELLRKDMPNLLADFPALDTKDDATNYCAIPGGRGGKFKWPSLTELHTKLFGEAFAEAHNASADVEATARCFLELIRLSVIPFAKAGMTAEQLQNYKSINQNPFELIGLNIEPYSPVDTPELEDEIIVDVDKTLSDTVFCNNASSYDLTSFLLPTTSGDGSGSWKITPFISGGVVSNNQLVPTALVPGVYSLKYALGTGACSDSDSVSIRILPILDPTIDNEPAADVCVSLKNYQFNNSGDNGGVWSVDPSATIDVVTGDLTLTEGTFEVKYRLGTTWIY